MTLEERAKLEACSYCGRRVGDMTREELLDVVGFLLAIEHSRLKLSARIHEVLQPPS